MKKIILHQTGPNIIPKVYLDCRKTWLNNLFDYKFYSDNDLVNLVKLVVPEKYPFFCNLRKIEKIDFARYVMLYYYGGIYADMDIILKNKDYFYKKLICDDIKDILIIGIEFNKLRYHAAQAILISSHPKNIFWMDLINYICINYSKKKYITYNTGPDLFTAFLKKNKEKYNLIFEEKILKEFTKHIKTGSWRLTKYIKLNKYCLICNHSPFICNCYNYKWFRSNNFIYYNWKLFIIASFSFIVTKFLYSIFINIIIY